MVFGYILSIDAVTSQRYAGLLKKTRWQNRARLTKKMVRDMDFPEEFAEKQLMHINMHTLPSLNCIVRDKKK